MCSIIACKLSDTMLQGEEGDRFYIVEAGACHVLGADGHSVGQRLG